MYKKREFIVKGIPCQAILKGRFLHTIVNMSKVTIKTTIEFKPFTPSGLKLRQFESDAPEKIADGTLNKCRPFWEATSQEGGRA